MKNNPSKKNNTKAMRSSKKRTSLPVPRDWRGIERVLWPWLATFEHRTHREQLFAAGVRWLLVRLADEKRVENLVTRTHNPPEGETYSHFIVEAKDEKPPRSKPWGDYGKRFNVDDWVLSDSARFDNDLDAMSRIAFLRAQKSSQLLDKVVAYHLRAIRDLMAAKGGEPSMPIDSTTEFSYRNYPTPG